MVFGRFLSRGCNQRAIITRFRPFEVDWPFAWILVDVRRTVGTPYPMVVVLQPTIVTLPLRVEQLSTARLARARPTRGLCSSSTSVCHSSLFVVGTGGGVFCRGGNLLVDQALSLRSRNGFDGRWLRRRFGVWFRRRERSASWCMIQISARAVARFASGKGAAHASATSPE